MEHVRQMENKLALLDSSIKHLQDARKELEAHLFGRKPSTRIDADFRSADLSINSAQANLSEAIKCA